MQGLLKHEAEKHDLPPHNTATASLSAKVEHSHTPPVQLFINTSQNYELAHAAQSLTGIHHLQFLDGEGLKCSTFDEWAKAFKSAMLPLSWVSETEKKIYSLQPQLLCLDKIASALMDFKQWFTLLKDSDSPMSEAVATHWLRNHMAPSLLAELKGISAVRANFVKQSAFTSLAPTHTPIAAISPESPMPEDIAHWLKPWYPLLKGAAGRCACAYPEPTAIAAVSTFDHEEAEFAQEGGEMFAKVLITHLAPELSVPPILLEWATITLVDPSLVTAHHLQSYPSKQHWVVVLAGGAQGLALEC
ncbi:hypothetical protein D1P53_004956 [Cryptococcus gattii VGV]|nr:hypothetical protein D1P53_004956 [Cryptococcus gattii VGV]